MLCFTERSTVFIYKKQHILLKILFLFSTLPHVLVKLEGLQYILLDVFWVWNDRFHYNISYVNQMHASKASSRSLVAVLTALASNNVFTFVCVHLFSPVFTPYAKGGEGGG